MSQEQIKKIKYIKVKKFKVILLFLLILLFGEVSADPNVDLIRAYYKTMEKFSIPSTNKVYHISYKEELIPKGGGKVSTSNVNIYASGNKFYCYTGIVDVFQDEEDAFLIVHKEKMIYQSNSPENQQSRAQFTHYIKVQDQFFKNGKILLSEIVVLNGKKVARVSIATPKDLDPALKVVRTTYWFDIEGGKLMKTKVDYDQSYKIKSRVTTYNQLNLDYKKKLRKAVFKQVLDKKGQLIEPYESYKLVVNK